MRTSITGIARCKLTIICGPSDHQGFWTIDLSSILELRLSWLGVTRTSITGIARCEFMIRYGPSIHQERGPSIWATSWSFTYRDLEWREPPSKEQQDARSWKDLDWWFIEIVERRSGSMKIMSSKHILVHPVVTWRKDLVQMSFDSKFCGSRLRVSRH